MSTVRSRPNFTREAAHGGLVAGVDEVGRGPLAGPVVAAAVVFPNGVPDAVAPLLDDSKRLSPATRQIALTALRESEAAWIAVAAASVQEIARLNILHASLLAMRRAVLRLPKLPDLALIDGNMVPSGLPCPAQAVVGGDATSLSIAASSIVAKIVRDRCMARLAQRYPGYGWESNAGYPAPAHRKGIAELGITPHHRAGFGTVARLRTVGGQA